MAILAIEGTKPDGTPYREAFNSYYLAIVQKNKLMKKGYKLQVVEPEMYDRRNATTLRYSRKEKETFLKLKKERRKNELARRRDDRARNR